jgi:TatD DNase family protein
VDAQAGISFFDAHCHLQDERLRGFLDAVLSRAEQAGVTAMSCCGTSEKDWEAVKKVAGAHSSLRPSFGLHPWFIADKSRHWDETLLSYLAGIPLAYVGEIGLDHALDESSFADQETVFRKQLAIAAQLGRPVSIHCRRAFGRLVEILNEIGGIVHGGIVHSYSGSAELVKPLEDFGLSLSFSGSITFSKNKRARESVTVVSPDRLCLETDSPDMKPYHYTGDLNEPASIIPVAETVASLLGASVKDIASRTMINASRIFNRKLP